MTTRPSLIRALVAGAGALLLAAGLAVPMAAAPSAPAEAAPSCTLSNPISNGADPSVWLRNGVYYLAQSDGARSISLKAASTLSGLSTATARTIFTAPTGTDHSAQTWAPELEYLDGRWIIYYAAATDRGSFDATNDTHRMFAITANGQTPWARGRSPARSPTPPTSGPSTEPCSGTRTAGGCSGRGPRPGTAAGRRSRSTSPTCPIRCTSTRTTVASSATPTRPGRRAARRSWRRPEAWISPSGTLSIVYNANASWTTSYALGMLVYKGGDMTTYQSYAKRGPVFSSGGASTAPAVSRSPSRVRTA